MCLQGCQFFTSQLDFVSKLFIYDFPTISAHKLQLRHIIYLAMTFHSHNIVIIACQDLLSPSSRSLLYGTGKKRKTTLLSDDKNFFLKNGRKKFFYFTLRISLLLVCKSLTCWVETEKFTNYSRKFVMKTEKLSFWHCKLFFFSLAVSFRTRR